MHSVKINNKIFLLVLLFISTIFHAQTPAPIDILTLGTFHFNFPNLDVVIIAEEEQIDVLEEKYQQEIAVIVSKLEKFQPTIIVIERRPAEQSKTDSLYHLYTQGHYTLARGEEEQIGFRLAKQLNLNKLYCVDEWGNFSNNILDLLNGKDSVETRKFEAYYYDNPDIPKRSAQEPIFKSQGILAELMQLNDAEAIKRSLGDYLIGHFKYEAKPYDFTGVDFETGRWFSRNLKIFRNIQRIPAIAGDKILVIYGAGHLNLLNYFFECSPEYRLMNVHDYLEH